MCYSHTDKRISMLHKRYQRIIYNDKQSSFPELLTKDSSASIYVRNIQSLTIEMFQFCKGLSPSFDGQHILAKNENPYNFKISEFSRSTV